jgi:predicted RNA binding protein YcfA (HicA-like mRNA interferase family)
MPPGYPHLSGKEVIKTLEKMGFVIVRQKGSHLVLRNESHGCVVPDHAEIKVGTLSGILKQAGISLEEFLRVYNA